MNRLIPYLLLMIPYWLNAQEHLSMQRVESTSYRYFVDKQWEELIAFGEHALAQGFDYYYLRYRMGVAFFEQQKYFSSTHHFEKALAFASTDGYTKEYLYYCYLYTGRADDARLVVGSLTARQKETTGLGKKTFSGFLNVESGLKISNRPDTIGDLFYAGFGLGHTLGSTWRFYHALSYLQQVYLGYPYKQYEYYLGANWQFAKGWGIQPAFHYIYLDGEYSNSNAMAFHLGIARYWQRFYFAPSVSWSNGDGVGVEGIITSTEQWQYGMDIAFTPPVLKDKLRISTYAGLQHRQQSNYYIWKAKATYYFTPKVNMQLAYFRTNTTMVLEDNASLFNNAISPTKSRFSVLINVQLSKRISGYALYQLENKRETQFDFKYNTFMLGVKYSF